MLKKGSFVPLYYQLKEELKEKIVSGEWEPETCIPSIRELCAIYGISTTTAKQAISELVQEGLLYSVQGKGTFVSVPQWPMEYKETTYITDEMRLASRVRALGHEFWAEVLTIDRVRASNLVSAYLTIENDSEVLRIRRLKKADGVPMLIETTFMSPDVASGIEEADLSRSLFRILRDGHDILLTKSDETFRPVFLDSLEAELLGQKVGSLAMLNERISYAETSTPILYAKSLIRGDMCKTYIDLTNMRKVKEMVVNASSF
ncbi:MAG: GntR family transcriptional regulator [Firmicutes bacterium]|nr:GntR family transcriptional regulator [Bacillota bacterium]MDD4336847.1 GntR family transcriptional regulator [Bacillota bacterium]MDD4792826.1 GntR family transcriptional regulator [Bacillota bacterium]